MKFRILSTVIISSLLFGCGESGVDKKLDYSSADKLGASYGDAMKGASPEQINVMTKRSPEIFAYIIWLETKSNPMVVEANTAQENNKTYEKVRNMSVKELFNWYFEIKSKDQNLRINAAEKFLKEPPVTVENVSIKKVDCHVNQGEICDSSFNVIGNITFKANKDFGISLNGGDLKLKYKGKEIGHTTSPLGFRIMQEDSNAVIDFYSLRIEKSPDIDIPEIFLKLNNNDTSEISFEASPKVDTVLIGSNISKTIYSTRSGSIYLNQKDIESDKKILMEIQDDLSVINKQK